MDTTSTFTFSEDMFVVIEGVDGSGKATQTALLKETFLAQGKSVATITYPRYGHPAAYFVEQFLNGTYGPIDGLDPYLSSLFYTVDRFDHRQEVLELIATHDVVISDRYSLSSFVHRGSQFLQEWTPEKILPFFDWMFDLEFKKAGLPLPDLTFFLALSIESIQQLLIKKSQTTRAYLKEWTTLDLPEVNIEHQRHSLSVGTEILPSYFPNYHVVACEEEGEWLLTPEAISQKLLSYLV